MPSGIDTTLGGESVRHSDAFKYFDLTLDSSLSLNQHIDYLKKKVGKMLGMFLRAQPLLSIEAVNRLFKSMFLPILDYCGAVFHGCGKSNEEGLECLQRRVGRIVLNTAHLSTEQMALCLTWDTLMKRRENHIVNPVEKCFNRMAASFSPNIFNLKDIIYLKTTHNMSTVTFYKLNTYIFC